MRDKDLHAQILGIKSPRRVNGVELSVPEGEVTVQVEQEEGSRPCCPTSGHAGTKDFPLTDIPMQAIVDQALQGIYQARPAHVFRFDEIAKAHELMEANSAIGKIVVEV